MSDASRFERFLFRQQLRGARYFDTTKVGTKDLPLDTEDAIIGLTPGDEELAMMDLGAVDLSSFSAEKLDKLHERTQDRFSARVKKFALALAAGSLSLLAWHRLMRDEVKQHVLQQALLGGRGALSDVKRIDGLVRRETDYLSRFADELARDGASGRTASRAGLYGGSGRSAFYRERESDLPSGYVVEYIARDDDSTCSPCSQAAGFYLPLRGPYPGSVCLGRANCRCRRALRFDPSLALSLGVRS